MKKYRETGYRVDRKTPAEIRRIAQYLRDFAAAEYGITGDIFDPGKLIEKWGAMRARGHLDNPDFLIVPDIELPGRAAEYRPPDDSAAQINEGENLFIFRDSVWNAASSGDPDARQTLAHEIGHCVLRHPKVSYGRVYQDEVVDRHCDSENQANLFMDELLMDSRLISVADGWGSIMRRFNVTKEAAKRRQRLLMLERRQRN